MSEREFDDYLDDIYPEYTIGGVTIQPSVILKNCDPIAYRCAYLDYADDMEESDD